MFSPIWHGLGNPHAVVSGGAGSRRLMQAGLGIGAANVPQSPARFAVPRLPFGLRAAVDAADTRVLRLPALLAGEGSSAGDGAGS